MTRYSSDYKIPFITAFPVRFPNEVQFLKQHTDNVLKSLTMVFKHPA